MADQYRHHSLQPTLLVNEAFIRLIQSPDIDWQDRQHFYTLAARMMRRIIIDYFRGRDAQKRPPRSLEVPLEGAVVFDDSRREESLDVLDEALEQLNKFDPRAASVVELRYFGGMSITEIASLLNVAERTVRRDWLVAQAWLKRYFDLPASES